MADSNASVIARFSAHMYLKFTCNSQATALGHFSFLTALIFRTPSSNLFWSLFDGIPRFPTIDFGIAAVTNQVIYLLVEKLRGGGRQ